MATAAKNKPVRSKQARGLSTNGALDMFRGKGANRVTFYSCGVVDQAKANKVAIRVIDADGKVVLTKARKVHRSDLLGVFGDTTEIGEAGQGKYIKRSALSANGKQVVGYQNINPYFHGDGSYATIVDSFYHLIGAATLRGLKANVLRSRDDGVHLKCVGPRTKDDAVTVSSWILADDLWDLARKQNPKLVSTLRGVKCERDDVSEHLDAREKFDQNLWVMRRARRNILASGKVEISGGATPYAMPLEQCDMCIDMAFLTDGFDKNGQETGNYYYRLAIGRSTPMIVYRRDWRGRSQGVDADAYLNDRLFARAKALKSKNKKAA